MAGGDAKLGRAVRARRALRLSLCAAPIAAVLAAEAARWPITVRADPPRLEWSMFRRVDAMPDPSEDAHIAAEISFPQPLRVERVDGRYRLPPFTITVALEPGRTMVRRSLGRADDLLRHEQGHFDIVLLAARALARELESTSASSGSELTSLVESRVAKHTERAERLSEEYDRQTDRSRDPAAQRWWNERIAAALRDSTITRIAGLAL
ncbi:MAG: DUF922 domain-containing protein [Deltaproteobacteria bacterium]|nr:DUF922 domain-containing protein [Deltaproteobacteria bacterium]